MHYDFSRLTGLEPLLEQKRQEQGVPGMSVGVVHEGKLVYTRHFGYRDVENRLTADNQTRYALASVTKAMTATALGILKDEGLIDWNTPVSEYIPGWKLADEYATQHITLRDMLSHNTGLPRHDAAWYHKGEGVRTLAENVAAMAHLPFNKEPRTRYEYNNFMFAAAGYVVEKVTGTPWAEFVRQRIFAPLGMGNSDASIRGMQTAENRALPYREMVRGQAVLGEYMDFDHVGPCGAACSTIEDMAKWVACNLAGGTYDGVRILSEETLREIHSPITVEAEPSPFAERSTPCYAMGWCVDYYRGHRAVHHSGGIDGFSTFVHMLPDEKLAVIALCNMDGANLMFSSTYTIYDTLLGNPTTDWPDRYTARKETAIAQQQAENDKILALKNPQSKPCHALSDYAGVYEEPGYGKLELQLAGEGLSLTYGGFTYPMIHLNLDTFYINLGETWLESLAVVRFDSDHAGRIQAVQVDFDAGMKGRLIRFLRKQ